MAIHFTKEDIDFSLKKSAKLKKWILSTIQKEKFTAGEISYTFVNDETLLEMNKKYLNHNTYTDIITFDYSENKKVSGDIFISIDRVKANAVKFKVDFEQELHRVMIHGILHLCGYKDKSTKQAAIMRQKEELYLKLFQKN